MYGETYDFRCQHQQWQHTLREHTFFAVNLTLKLFRVHVADADI